jgi:hypothetical protein
MSYGKSKFRNKYKETNNSLKIIRDNYYVLDTNYQMLNMKLLEIKKYINSSDFISLFESNANYNAVKRKILSIINLKGDDK